MIVDFRNPESIAAWYAVNPAKHGAQIAAFKAMWPRFADAITKAGEIIRAQ